MLDQKLAELRKKKGLSQEELAEVLSTTRQAVSKWERGDAYPDIEKLKDLARFFDVSIDFLLDYDIESLSLNEFSSKLLEKANTNIFDVTLDEIKGMITKNPNNLNLFLVSSLYLIKGFKKFTDQDVEDLIISYLNKSLVLYKRDNIFDASINDIHQMIVSTYFIFKDYVRARDYIKKNKVHGADEVLVFADYQLGNFEDAMKKSSDLYLESIMSILNVNINRILILLREDKTSDAYDLSKWSVDFVKSIYKKESSLNDVTYCYMFLNAICERHLGIQSDTINYLKDNYHSVISMNNSKQFNYFFNEDTSIFTTITDIKQEIIEYGKPFVGLKIYYDMLYVYNEVFGGKEDE